MAPFADTISYKHIFLQTPLQTNTYLPIHKQTHKHIPHAYKHNTNPTQTHNTYKYKYKTLTLVASIIWFARTSAESETAASQNSWTAPTNQLSAPSIHCCAQTVAMFTKANKNIVAIIIRVCFSCRADVTTTTGGLIFEHPKTILSWGFNVRRYRNRAPTLKTNRHNC